MKLDEYGQPTRESVEAVVHTFNDLLGRVNCARRGFLTLSKATLQKASVVAKFVHDHKLPLGPYMTSCFARYQWNRYPRLHHMTSERALRAYKAASVEAHHVHRVLGRQRASEVGGSTELVPRGQEIMKQRWTDIDPDLCRMQRSITGGYNAHSPTCSGCPVAKECARG